LTWRESISTVFLGAVLRFMLSVVRMSARSIKW